MPLPLDGIVVLDLTRALAGPYATALLADLGATIIKVESKKGGDSTRSWPPFEGAHSLYFDSVNRNKSSIAIDFYSPEGAALLRRMALDADVVIENFKPGTMAEMGLDPAGLRAEKPSLIVASVSGFGSSGPLAQAAGLDQVAQGMSGLMSVTGDDAEHPTRVGVPIVDIYAGVFTAVGIAAALVARERTGGAENGAGRLIETSLLEAAIAVSAFQGQRYLSTGEIPEPQGNNHPVLAPYGVFATADIPIIIAAGNDRHFQQLAELLGEPALADDPEFATGRARSGHRQELTERLEQLLAARPGLEWVDELRRIGIPAGPILNYEQVFRDPQVRHLDMVTHLTRRDGSALPLLRGPITVDGVAPSVRKAPPALGEDTRAVLDRLGLTAEQIEGLLGGRHRDRAGGLMPELRVEVAGPVATLTIDNPARRNALTGAMWDSFAPVLAELATDTEVAALVVRGAGDDFSAGADIRDLDQILRDPHAGDGGHVTAGERALAAFPKPTIAAIDGYCVGGGWELAGACDIRLASERSTFGVTPARLGILYPLTGVTRLVQLAGPAAAKHLILSGELVDAATAARWGMVSRLLPVTGFWTAIGAFVDALVSRSRLTQQASKELIDLIADRDPALADRAAFWDAEVASSDEARIGAAAFLAREAPVFTWRGIP